MKSLINSDDLNEYEKNVLINEIHALSVKGKKKVKYNRLVLDLVELSMSCETNFNLEENISINAILRGLEICKKQ